MSDAFIPEPDAADQRHDGIAEEIERDGGLPIDAPEADVIEQREEPAGDDEIDEYR